MIDRRRLLELAVGGASIASGLTAGVLWREFNATSPTDHASRKSSSVRDFPVCIYPSDGLATLVPTEALRRLLLQLVPCWHAVKLSRILHAFRLWGPHAQFVDDVFPRPFVSQVFDGKTMRSILLDHEVFASYFPGEPPILLPTTNGVRVRTDAALNAQHLGQLIHDNDLLCACAEVSIPSSGPVRTFRGQATLADVLQESEADFTLTQELEWTSEAFARYIAPRSRWNNRFGNVFTFDQVVDALMDKPFGSGACLGGHVSYAVTALYRVNQDHSILGSKAVARISEYLRRLSARLEQCQGPGGYRLPPDATVTPLKAEDRLSSLAASTMWTDLSYTSHQLEWIAIAPERLRPGTESIRKAIDGIMRSIGRLTVYDVTDLYCDLSHLARALCLMKGVVEPHTFVSAA